MSKLYPSKSLSLSFSELDSDEQLLDSDKQLLDSARMVTQHAYAPYSNFSVGAAALLSDGSIVTGTNQENAGYGLTMCAEQSLFLSLAAQNKHQLVTSMALSFNNPHANSDFPISPCGKCRQFLLEFEQRIGHDIKIIMSGQTGKVIIINSIRDLLPFAFDDSALVNQPTETISDTLF